MNSTMDKCDPPQTTPPDIQVLIGIDWADAEHAYHVRDAERGDLFGSFKQQPEDIARQFNDWRARYPGATFCIAIEQSRGPLISALIDYEDITIYPINPAAMANYRKAFAHGGGKSDPVDARLLVDFLQHYLDRLKPLVRDLPLTRELAGLGEDRRGLVDRRAALGNELRAILKLYLPCILLLEADKMYAHFIVRFLLKYRTLEDIRSAGKTKLRKFFFGISAELRCEQRITLLMSAVPLTSDEVIVRTNSRRVQAIVAQLDVLNRSITEYDRQIKKLVKKHANYAVVASLPGASAKTHCRILAALGDHKSRYQDALALQAATGIAPITTQSGRLKVVSCRWASSKFLKQTFHEYAGLSIRKCPWAKAYYDMQIANGHSAQMAKRSLAFKWLRIIFRCWQSDTKYDDQKYMQRLQAEKAPLLKYLPQ